MRALNSGAQAQITHREACVLAPFAISHATRRATHGVVCHAHGVVGTPVINSECISAPIERGSTSARECPVAARCHLPLARIRSGRLPWRTWPGRLHGGFQRRDRNDWLKVAVVNRLPHGALHKLWLARDLQVLRAGIRGTGEYVAIEQQECLARQAHHALDVVLRIARRVSRILEDHHVPALRIRKRKQRLEHQNAVARARFRSHSNRCDTHDRRPGGDHRIKHREEARVIGACHTHGGLYIGGIFKPGDRTKDARVCAHERWTHGPRWNDEPFQDKSTERHRHGEGDSQ